MTIAKTAQTAIGTGQRGDRPGHVVQADPRHAQLDSASSDAVQADSRHADPEPDSG